MQKQKQGRQLSAKDNEGGMIHCAQWHEDAIPADDMENGEGIYDASDVRSILLRINGGVTSAVVRQAVTQLETNLRTALTSFSTSGFKNEPEMSSFREAVDKTTATAISAIKDSTVQLRLQSEGSSSSMLRIGAPKTFNMKCYSTTSLPADAASFASMGAKEGTNCAHNMLMWMRNEGMNFERQVHSVCVCVFTVALWLLTAA
jgi:hypothetical protein